MAGRKTNELHSYVRQARADKVQLRCSAVGDIQKAAGNVGASVVNAEDDRAVIPQISYFDSGPERKGAVSGRELVHIVDFTVRRHSPVKRISIPTGSSQLPDGPHGF